MTLSLGFFPDQRTLNINKIKATYLGNYIPWDVRKQVDIIKKELDWEGDQVEGIPEEYDYEKIECVMQGVRDYTKFLKRGFGRTAHLVSIDIRNKRMTREKGIELVKNYDGFKPHALEYFLKIIDMTEDEYYEEVFKHVVEPHKPEDMDTLKSKISNKRPKDFDNFFKKYFKKMKIGIINYDNCNISSIFYSLYNLGANVEIIEQNQKLKTFLKLYFQVLGRLQRLCII